MESEVATETPVELSTALPEVDADTMAPEPVANINDASESLEDILDAAAAQVAPPMDVLPSEPTGNLENQDPKTNITQSTTTEMPKEVGTFNLGVPGLKFSANNVRTAKDGTKMVQIHQSQITPDQLQALQNNPNIKVVFRHVPSGKSYTKPPRHLLPPGYSAPIKKRKAYFTEEELEGSDVYNFDEGDDLQGPAKRSKLGDMRAKYMHGYGGVSRKKGRPRAIPEAGNYSSNYSKPNLPAKVILTDLLTRVNNPNAKNEVKLHTSQINAEVLANMELNPMYKIILTTKQELPPLVIENVNAEEQAKLELDAKEIEKQEKENEKEEEKQVQQHQETNESEEKKEEMDQDQPELERMKQQQEEEEEEKRRLEEEEEARQKKLAEEEEELKRSVASPQISRSGRIRKPSRYSLDIARLTKRKSTVSGGDSSAEDSEHESKLKQTKSKTQEAVVSPGRGKAEKEEEEKRKKEEARKMIEEEKKKKEEEDRKKKEEEERSKKEKEEKHKKEEEQRKKEEEETAAKKKQEEKEEQKKDEEKETTQEEAIGDSKEGQDPPSESEKAVTSTENQKKDGDTTTTGAEQDQEKTVPAEPGASTDQGKSSTEDTKKKDETMDVDEPFSLKLTEEEEEKEVIDNKFRLRKLLEQCSTEEIRSVLLPEAFDAINIGDFLLYKSGQMHSSSGKVNFPQLYQQFEKLHKDASIEALRYNTLVRRANKVGGEKRMEKIVLMPVYNIDAANSLEISNSSIDAHICGIQRTITTEMIAANSFFIKSKMDSPTVRLNFPEITVRKNNKPKEKRQLYTNQHQQPFASSQQPEIDSTTPDKPKQPKRASYGQKIASMKFSTLQTKSQMTSQVRRPTYIEQLKTTGQITLGGQNHQIATKTQDNLQNIPVDANLLRSDVQSSQMAATATAALAQMQATADQQQAVVSTTSNVIESHPIGQVMGTAETTLVSSASDTSGQAEQFFVTEDGVPVASTGTDDGEVRKQLVPIGDGQYVELPEGYSLIQTSEGYIIGQPGSTFTQGEDGNVYITNSDGTTTEITQQDVSGEADNPNIIDAVTEG